MNATAVIITGQARTFAHCFKTQREAVFRKLENPHFFVSFASPMGDRDVYRILDQMKADYPGRVFVEFVDQPTMPEDMRERFEAESFHAPWYRSVPVEGIWKQFWHLARGWEFSVGHIQAMNVEAKRSLFNRFVRIRPDLHFHNWTPPREVSDGLVRHRESIAPPPEWRQPAGVHAPWWGSWGGCPDRFAYIVGADAAAQYFNVFHRINELLAEGCAFHPETMLARALERAGVRVMQTMDAEFTTIRVKGDSRPHDKPSYSNRDVLNYINARLGEADLR